MRMPSWPLHLRQQILRPLLIRRRVIQPLLTRGRFFRDRRRRVAASTSYDHHVGPLPIVGLVVATALAGLLFSPVFGASFAAALVIPIVALAAVTCLCFGLAHLWAPAERWRPALNLVLGLLAVVQTTLRGTTDNGLPTSATGRSIYDGVRKSWLLTLQSTWPARPEPRLVVFVPLLVLVALVIGVQVLTRTSARLAALLPSLAVAGLAQAFHPLSGTAAVSVVFGYAAAAALVLSALRPSNLRFAGMAAVIAMPAVLLFALTGAAADPAGRAAYSLKNETAPVAIPTAVTSPLDEIAYRLQHPRTELFTVHGSPKVDRWPLAVLDSFDGSNWSTDARYRYLGSRLDVDPISAGVSSATQTASVDVTDLPGPWLPSQRGLRKVSGVSPLVDEDTGTLLDDAVTPGTRYRLRWSAPDVSGNQVADASLAVHPEGGAAKIGATPADIVSLAKKAVNSAPASFRAALELERYLRENYRLAAGHTLPAGHGWPQIQRFLNNPDSKDTAGDQQGGTSEQFATAYVVLAHALGIPARLVVGFRQPANQQADGDYVVRNADVLAWPEVAVQTIGWIPLDPSGIDRGTGSAQASSGLARATDQARAELPPPARAKPKPQPAPTAPQAATPLAPPTGGSWPVAAIGLGIAIVLIGWLLGIPLAKELRSGSRRRRPGNAAVVSAWLETRDRLRDHGIPIERGMTVRDVAVASHGMISRSAQHAVEQLGSLVDAALWSGHAVSGRGIDIAWQACDIVRHSLADRPMVERLSAAVGVRGLRRLR